MIFWGLISEKKGQVREGSPISYFQPAPCLKGEGKVVLKGDMEKSRNIQSEDFAQIFQFIFFSGLETMPENNPGDLKAKGTEAKEEKTAACCPEQTKNINPGSFESEPASQASPKDSSSPAAFKACFAQAAKVTGLPETLLKAVGQVESNLRHINQKTGQIIQSPGGAVGIMQLLPSTAREMGLNPFSLPENILAGAKYLARARQEFHGKVELALAGYNAGINQVQKAVQKTQEESWEAVKDLLPKETQNYVAKVIALLKNQENINPGSFENEPVIQINNRAHLLIKPEAVPAMKNPPGNIILAHILARPEAVPVNHPVSLPELPLLINWIFEGGKDQFINQHFQTQITAPNTIVKVRLVPEKLGALTVKVTQGEEKLTVHFSTPSQKTREILEALIPQLKEAITQQNPFLKETAIFVSQEQGEGKQTRKGWSLKNKFNSHNIKTEEGDLRVSFSQANLPERIIRVNYWV